jgi:hypothetical protein
MFTPTLPKEITYDSVLKESAEENICTQGRESKHEGVENCIMRSFIICALHHILLVKFSNQGG